MVVSLGHYPDLYILAVSTNIVLISSFFTNRLFRQYPVLPELSILVPNDICVQQNNQIMPNLSAQTMNFKAEVKAELKLYPWGQTCH